MKPRRGCLFPTISDPDARTSAETREFSTSEHGVNGAGLPADVEGSLQSPVQGRFRCQHSKNLRNVRDADCGGLQAPAAIRLRRASGRAGVTNTPMTAPNSSIDAVAARASGALFRNAALTLSSDALGELLRFLCFPVIASLAPKTMPRTPATVDAVAGVVTSPSASMPLAVFSYSALGDENRELRDHAQLREGCSCA